MLKEHERENRKAQFIEALRMYYDPDSLVYSGLAMRYRDDLLEWIRCYEWIDPKDPRHLSPRLFPVPERSEEELQRGVRGLPQQAQTEETAGCA